MDNRIGNKQSQSQQWMFQRESLGSKWIITMKDIDYGFF